MKRILVAEPEEEVNKKTFAIDIVVGGCSAANHRHEHQQRLDIPLTHFQTCIFYKNFPVDYYNSIRKTYWH